MLSFSMFFFRVRVYMRLSSLINYYRSCQWSNGRGTRGRSPSVFGGGTPFP